jgi:hypothetical protein
MNCLPMLFLMLSPAIPALLASSAYALCLLWTELTASWLGSHAWWINNIIWVYNINLFDIFIIHRFIKR